LVRLTLGFMSMESLLRVPFIKSLEAERQKYNQTHHEPTTHQLKRFSVYCQLLKQDPQLLGDKKRSARSRIKTTRENLSRVSRLSSSIFVLCCFVVGPTELGSKSYLELIPKLRDWWGCVEHPKALIDKARVYCEAEDIEYVGNGELQRYILIVINLHSTQIKTQIPRKPKVRQPQRALRKAQFSCTGMTYHCFKSAFSQANHLTKPSISPLAI
jgi:hypothetical protein